MHLWSGLNLADVTQFACPRRIAMVRPVATSQICAVPSMDADSTHVPLASNTTETTPSQCSWLMNSNTVGFVRALKNSVGDYYWKEGRGGAVEGQPPGEGTRIGS